jgi:hypothetical protein
MAQPEGQPCMPEPTDQLLVYGDHLNPCQIGSVADADLFRFNGVLGEVVSIRVTDQEPSTAFNPACSVELLRPDGSHLAGTTNGVTCEVRTTLDRTGLFTIRLSEYQNDALMTYTLELDRLHPFSPVARSINPDDTFLGERIAPKGDADIFLFNGVNGDVVSFRVTDLAGGAFEPAASIELYRPDGSLVTALTSGSTVVLDRTLDQTGVFSVRVTEYQNSVEMTFNITYQCLLGSCPTFYPLTVGTTGAGRVTSNPIGIDCGLDCIERYFGGTVVTLTPVPAAGAIFNGWTGDADCADGLVTMSAEQHCIASFSTSTLPPTTVEEAYVTARDVPMVIGPPGVLGNDNSNGGGAMTAQLVAGVSHGGLALNANGSFTYTPAVGFAGLDSFSYSAVNANGPGNTAVVTLNVTAQSPPNAANDTYDTLINQQVDIPAPGVLANDNSNGGGAMTVNLVSGTSVGTLALSVNGGFTYVPPAGFVGTETFTYRAVNIGGPGNLATVAITVHAVTTPQPPSNLVVDTVQGPLVTVRFTPPVAGPAPSGYVLKGGVLPGQVLATMPTGHTAPVFTFLAPNGSFRVRVHTLANGNESGPSNEVALHVGVAVPPSPPTRLTGMVNGSSVTLSWKRTFEGGPPLDMLLDVSGSLTTTLSLGPSDSFSFPAVPAGTYTFRVRAANGAGPSASSNAVTLSFPGGCSGVPHAPDNFLAYRIGSMVFVMWDPPDTGPAPTQYLVTVTGAFAGAFPTTARMISGAVGPGTYGLSVRTINPCGAGPATAEQIVTVP